ncbi:putative transmembrane protein [Gregarina niphandrodes]|uniref:Transmembrane protein n=1 Tax=Gregarina niphandrodes TaxID=110365 RepID=A0A023AYB6_GRENI|nr:putative transmembrane protein [Gregarina niphandrodes]EZG43662.1 putative transmembrane protein [Gregarina niphandrodes]|eukprot:XP_011133108.1 putative transmembrane protein [Gregarina niphandrodes]
MQGKIRLLIINVYLWIVSIIFLFDCHPWYCYFQYLTAWAWIFVKAYFGFSFYLATRKGRGWSIRGLDNVVGSMEHGRNRTSITDNMEMENAMKENAMKENVMKENAHKVAADCLERSCGTRSAGQPDGVENWWEMIGEIAQCVSVIVVVMFWGLVWPQESALRCFWWEVNMHGVGLLLLLYERCTVKGCTVKGCTVKGCTVESDVRSAKSWRWTTQPWLWAFVALYTGIHVAAFFSRGRRPIYPGVDLTTQRGLALYVSVAAALISLHGLAVLLHTTRPRLMTAPPQL